MIFRSKFFTPTLWLCVPCLLLVAFSAYLVARRSSRLRLLNSPDVVVTNALLNQVRGADKVVVSESSMYRLFNPGAKGLGGGVLLTLTSSQATAFAGTFEFREPLNGELISSCLCEGEFDVEFFKGKKTLTRLFVMEDGDVRSRDGLWRYDRPPTERARAKLAVYLSPLQHRAPN